MSWDVRTNIKAKPGSQGTLFQGGSDQMTDAKWPRGYTPQRLHGVRDAISLSPGTFRRAADWEHPGTAAETRKAVDNIARSTVPMEHLNDVQFRMNRPRLDDNAAGHYLDIKDSALGQYETPLIELKSGQAQTPVAIHEIGHHVSATAGTPHSAYNTVNQRGEEEAYADNYAQQHYRPRRGENFRGVGMYNGGEQDHIRTAQFFDAYHKHRDYTPVFGVKDLKSLQGGFPTPPGGTSRTPALPGMENMRDTRGRIHT